MQISEAAKRLVYKLRVTMYADESRYIESSALVDAQKAIDEATAEKDREIERLREDAEIGSFLRSEIKGMCESAGIDMSGMPPMMYPEAVLVLIQKKIAALELAIDNAGMDVSPCRGTLPRRERTACAPGWRKEMSKHTPGPWEVKSGMSCRRVEDTHGGAVTIIYNHQEYNGEACGSITSQNKTDDELQANARIIAAAPELLEACEALLVMMGKQGGHRKLDDQLTWRANDEKAEATARAAIAKAKGEVHGGEC